MVLERKASRASEIWALACAIFEIGSGFPLFESLVWLSAEVLEETVRISGGATGVAASSSQAEWDDIKKKQQIKKSIFVSYVSI